MASIVWMSCVATTPPTAPSGPPTNFTAAGIDNGIYVEFFVSSWDTLLTWEGILGVGGGVMVGGGGE